MTRETRVQKKALLKETLVFLFEDDGEHLYQMLEHNKILDLQSLVNQNDEDLLTLVEPDDMAIHNSIVVKLRTLRRYVKYHRYLGKQNDKNFCINKSFYQNIDIDDWDDFFGSSWSFASGEQHVDQLLARMGTANTTTTSAAAPASTNQTLDIVRDFTRGIKRDQSLFPKLKDEARWDNYNRDRSAQCRAQGVANVLDATYSPTTPEETTLFRYQNEYMYAVFTQTLLTDKAKAIVRRHEGTSDAQKVYAELVVHQVKSTKADLDQSTILAYLTSSTISDGNWNGTTHAYILNWLDKVRIYNTIADDILGEIQLKVMLQNAVKPISDLRQVAATAKTTQTATGKKITYDDYVNLLTTAAQVYDDSLIKDPRARARSRKIYEHNTYYHDEFNDNETIYNVDTPIYKIMETHQRKPQMGFSKWSKLSEEDRKMWENLSDDGKSIIIGHRPQQRVQLADASPTERQFLEAALHELRGDNLTTNSDHEKDQDDDNKDPPDCIEPGDLFAHIARRREANQAKRPSKKLPGDVTRLLSKAYAKKDQK